MPLYLNIHEVVRFHVAPIHEFTFDGKPAFSRHVFVIHEDGKGNEIKQEFILFGSKEALTLPFEVDLEKSIKEINQITGDLLNKREES